MNEPLLKGCSIFFYSLLLSSLWADPLAYAKKMGSEVVNLEATVPPQCYTKTEGLYNPCWVCHTDSSGLNQMNDWGLQREYAFSDVAMNNAWDNLFGTVVVSDMSDDDIQSYIEQDNFSPLQSALLKTSDFPGYVPDIDLHLGVDAEGFARDGSQWRSIRYKPFPGVFWPANGSTDDVFIRLPMDFRSLASGEPSMEVYKINLALMEMAVAISPEQRKRKGFARRSEPLDENLAQWDLNGDGTLSFANSISSLPKTYVGAANHHVLQLGLYPQGVEFLHSVRYVDSKTSNGLSKRLKELRYSRKMALPDPWAIRKAYDEEFDAKEKGWLPIFTGSPMVGLNNDFGWRYQGYIEDAEGVLRLQSKEEHLACMGCHNSIGVTVDSSFAFPRKLPGDLGYGEVGLKGIQDVPQVGHDRPETLVYFERAGGGDEFRNNSEWLQRFSPQGQIDESQFYNASVGGTKDLRSLLMPSPKRAMALNRAYLKIVRQQSFTRGRDAQVTLPENVHRHLENGDTDLKAAGRVFRDGVLWLDWDWSPLQ